jgi:hypothetical protein
MIKARGLIDDQYVTTLNDCMVLHEQGTGGIKFVIRSQLQIPHIGHCNTVPAIYDMINYINSLITGKRSQIKFGSEKVSVCELNTHINVASFRYLISAIIYSDLNKYT